MAAFDKYPPSPKNVPSNYTKPTGEYRFKTFAVLFSLFLFLMLYAAMILGIFYLIYLMIINFPGPSAFGSGRSSSRGYVFVVILYCILIASLFILIAFLVKGLFKSQPKDKNRLTELKEKDHPDLFEFINRICNETSAPKPKHVYLSPDVNAAVFYDKSILSLIIPPQKNLLIGAGLVNSVDLREFKAVLAHEFGHFSQKSMALGQYVYIANRILSDVVYGRDRWDDLLDDWCNGEGIFAILGFVMKGLIWVLRKIMSLIFEGINLLNLSLSRQMEFNADDVAVSVAGSDAIVTTLCKVEFADRCFAVAANDLITAADHRLFTSDIFYHQTLAADYIRKVDKKPNLGIPPEPPKQVFDPEDDLSLIPEMYSTHPKNHEREENAKREYFKAPPDTRSPWILFSDVEKVKRIQSKLFYKLALEKKKLKFDDFSEPEAVQTFIDSERSEMHYDPKYHGLFDDRFLRINDINDVEVSRNKDDKAILLFIKNFPPLQVKEFMEEHSKRQGESSFLHGLDSGELVLKGRTFEIRDKEYTANDVSRLLKKVKKEIKEDEKTFELWDKAMYENYFLAALALQPERAADLKRRYVFLIDIQSWILTLHEHLDRVHNALSMVEGMRKLQDSDFRDLTRVLNKSADALNDCHKRATDLYCPDMLNIEEGTKVSEIIRNDSWKIIHFNDESIEGKQVEKLHKGYQATLHRLRRLFFKSMGNILSRQEKIATEYTEFMKS
jgi:Zn-dependent protease with chaperone function